MFIGLLVALQCLHIFWFYLILKMIFRLMSGNMSKDERSDDEEELESEPAAGGDTTAGKSKAT